MKEADFIIKNGRDILLSGLADKQIKEQSAGKKIIIQPQDFLGIKPKLLIKEGDFVKIGAPLFVDRRFTDIKIVSPISGVIVKIQRGERRLIEKIIIESDELHTYINFDLYNVESIKQFSKSEIIPILLDRGLWPVFRQRPFSSVADPSASPKSIFVHAINTNPLASDMDFVLRGDMSLFQLGLDVISRITEGNVYVCLSADSNLDFNTEFSNIYEKRFSGPHPAGNVSTHINKIDPLRQGDIVWYIEAQDIIRIAQSLLSGKYSNKKIVAITGPASKNRFYVKAVLGTLIGDLLEGCDFKGVRCLSGNVLTGKNVGPKGGLCFYDDQVTVLKEVDKRELFGWLALGKEKLSFSNTFISGFIKNRVCEVDTRINGSLRPMVFKDIYNRYINLPIQVPFLLQAII